MGSTSTSAGVAIWRSFGRLFGAGTAAGAGEAELLHRFVTARDESAFEAIVERHGAMVWAACRRIAGEPADAEDAFQATFLVLVHRAAAIRQADRLGPWLHGVAVRVARKARARSAARRQREAQAMTARRDRGESVDPSPDDGHERGALLHAEIERLPAIYRDVVVLCDLEGCTHEEAARRLQCPVGTVKGRLSRAREKLRERLTRRGVAPAVGVASLLANECEAAAPAVPLVQATVRGAMAVASGSALAAGVVPAAVASLARGVLQAMVVQKLAIAMLAAGGVLSAGSALAQFGGMGGADAAPRRIAADPPGTKPAVAPARPDPPSVAAARKAYDAARRDVLLSTYEMARQAAVGRRGLMTRTEGLESLATARDASLELLRYDLARSESAEARAAAYQDQRSRMERLRDEFASLGQEEAEGFKAANPGVPIKPPTLPAQLRLYAAEAELWAAQAAAGETPRIDGDGETRPDPARVAPAPDGAPAARPGLEAGAPDERTRMICDFLDQPIDLPFPSETPLEEVIHLLKQLSDSEQDPGPGRMPGGLPIYVDPASLASTEVTMASPVTIELKQVRLKTGLRLLLKQLRLAYIVKDGMIMIGDPLDQEFLDEAAPEPGLRSGGGVPGYGLVPEGGFASPPKVVGAAHGEGGGGFQ